MRKIFGYLKPHIKTVCIIVVLLIVQAYCDLALPAYTSKIVDVGLQSSGVEHAAPDTLRKSAYDALSMLMTAEEQKTFESSYSENNGIYKRNADIKGKELTRLDEMLAPQEAMLYQLSQSGAVDADKIAKAYADGKIPQERMDDMRQKMSDSMSRLSDTMLEQLAVKYVIDEYSAQGLDLNVIQNHYLWMTGGKMLLVTVIMVIMAVLAGLLASKTAASVSRNLRQRVYNQVVSYSASEVNRFSTASLITRCTNDVQQIQMVMVMLLRMILYAPILGIGGIIRVVSTHTGLGWIIVVAVAATSGVIFGLMALAMPRFRVMQTLVDNVNRVSREILTGIMPIRAFSREKHEEERFDKANKQLKDTQLFTNRIMTFMMPSMMFIMYMVMGMIVWFGAKNIDSGMMQVGDLTAFLTYVMQIVMAFMLMSMVSIMLPRAGVAADRIEEVCSTKSSITDAENAVDINRENIKGEIEFRDVCFKFEGSSENALENISFKAEAGKTTAIIGSTGCGKSTILNLIPRFYDVTEGSVRIDGIDVRNITQSSLRSVLGYVPQKGMLFSGDIESNLKFGGDDITDEQMIKASEIAQAAEFIDTKPYKYSSPIAQGGSNVSGGQKQRLSIARAIAKSPKIFLFDDSFSALDYKTDTALRRALAENVSDATVIIVAQRISTILHADRIIVLNEGRIAGIGTHQQLLESCETYREIAKSQLSEKELTKNGGQV